MNNIYKDFEQQERANSEIDTQPDNFDQYRHPKRRSSSEYNRTDKTTTTAKITATLPIKKGVLFFIITTLYHKNEEGMKILFT
jgi:hypothetical protein